MGREVAAGITFVVAAGSGVVTSLVVARPSWGLWVALSVLVVLGAILQGLVIAGDRRSRGRVLASGAAAVAVGGSAQNIRTYVRGADDASIPSEGAEITASGSGSVSVGENAADVITTQQPDGEGTLTS
jgi:hypothetical protein